MRLVTGISQSELGDHLGVTFQQIQKYENGTNRISIGSMIAIAEFFKCSIAQFLPEITAPAETLADPLKELTAEAMHVAHSWNSIKDPNLRSTVKSLIISLSAQSSSMS